MYSYVYRPHETTFEMKNDCSSFTLSSLTWEYLGDYDLYSFKLEDKQVINLRDGATKDISGHVFEFDIDT